MLLRVEREALVKPEYRVPLMSEIASRDPNGLRLVSTFSGSGGSCLGFRMDGYRVLYANEFIPAARETYRANNPGTYVDERNIRDVTAESICEITRLSPGELDVLEGSPPCASFSTAGKREKHWGKVKEYSDSRERVDDLFFEYVRLVEGLRPRVFVAENVSGLVKGTAKGYFKEILRALSAPGYRVEARLLDGQWLGVPQTRQRVIFVGVREDLGKAPAFPKPLPYRYSIRDALAWKPGSRPELEPETDISRYAVGAEWRKLRQGQASSKYFQAVRSHMDEPVQTITAMGGINSGIASVFHPEEQRKFSIAELKRLCSFPDDFELTGTYSQRYERLGRAVPPLMMYRIAKVIREEILG